MAIAEATIRRVRYWPELIPDTVNVNLIANAEQIILDLRRFAPNILGLTDIAITRDDAVTMRIRADERRAEDIIAGSLTGNPNAALGGIFPNTFDICAHDHIRYALIRTAGVANFQSSYGLWVEDPTVAQKLKCGMTLTPEESALSKELGIADTVEKGLLPLPRRLQIEREYQVLQKITYGQILNTTAVVQTIANLYPRTTNEFIVLTAIATDPGTVAQDVRLTIDRDNDERIVDSISTWPLSLDCELPCFIPALREIRLSVVSTLASANWNIRYTICYCRLNSIVKARWNLMAPEQIPGDTWKKVKAGVL